MKTDYSCTKISLTECKKILQSDGLVYTDEEVIQIRDWMYNIADIAIQALESEENERKSKVDKLGNAV